MYLSTRVGEQIFLLCDCTLGGKDGAFTRSVLHNLGVIKVCLGLVCFLLTLESEPAVGKSYFLKYLFSLLARVLFINTRRTSVI